MRRRWDPFKVTEVTPSGGPGGSSSQPPGGAESATAKLRALFARHRTPILVGAAAVVAGAAYLQRGGSADPAETPGADIGAYAPAGATGAAGAYDSTGNDVYNALQPQIEQTQDMLTRMLDRFKRWRRRTRPRKNHPPKRHPHKHQFPGPGDTHQDPGPPPKKHHKHHQHKNPEPGHVTLHPHLPSAKHGPRRIPAPGPIRDERPQTVVARRGQTLSGLAASRGLHLPTVQKVNPSARQGLRRGQRVVLPVGRRRR